MKRNRFFLVILITVLAFTANEAMALPSLQLWLDPDQGATYRAEDETWFIADGGQPFNLTAFAVDQNLGSTAGDAFFG